MIHAFLSDDAFASLGISSKVSYTSLRQSGLGVIDDNLVNYFNVPTVLVDPRTATANINNRLQLASAKGVGRLLLHFDEQYLVENVDNLAPVIITETDNTTQQDTKNSILTRLFNTIEYIYLGRNNTNPVPESTIDATLRADSGTYSGYISGSIKVSSTVTPAVFLTTSGYSNTIPFYDSFSFKFNLDISNPNSFVEFKIWLNSSKFKAEYPYSTIVKVVYPCEPLRMLHPTERDAYGNNIDSLVTYEKIGAIIATSSYKDEQLEDAIKDYDHSGLAQYTTTYTNATLGRSYYMVFSILYRGITPSAASMRNAIRTALLAETQIGGAPLASESTWQTIFSDLFVNAGYYLIPMYYNRINYPAQVVIDRNIANYKKMYTILQEIFPDILAATILDKMEVLQAPGSGLYLITIPIEDNNINHDSLAQEHPTYQPIDALGDNSTYFNTMTPATQAFNIALASCIKVALGLIPNLTFTTEEINGREFIVFVNNAIEYHMITLEGARGIMCLTDNDGYGNETECEHVDGYTH